MKHLVSVNRTGDKSQKPHTSEHIARLDGTEHYGGLATAESEGRCKEASS